MRMNIEIEPWFYSDVVVGVAGKEVAEIAACAPCEAGVVPLQRKFLGAGGGEAQVEMKAGCGLSRKWSAISLHRKTAWPLIRSARRDRGLLCTKSWTAAVQVPPGQKGYGLLVEAWIDWYVVPTCSLSLRSITSQSGNSLLSQR